MEVQHALTNSFILFSLINIITFSGVTAAPDLISDVCSKTKDPKMCSKVLISDLRTLGAASYRQLGEASMNLSISGAQATKKTITRLRLVTIKKKLKARLNSCLTTYDSALYYLGTAAHYWNSYKFEDVAAAVAAASNEPIACRGYFADGEPPQPQHLREGNNKLETLCRVVLVISNRLSKKSFSWSQNRAFDIEYKP